MTGRPEISPRDARDRFISRRKQENTRNTVRSYENRLSRFVDWCANRGIESMHELSGWELDEYRADREASDVAPATLRGELMALKQLLDYCASIDVVDDDLPAKVNVPTLTRAEETSDEQLEHEDAQQLIDFYRDSAEWYGKPRHAFLEIAWHVGARMGGIRALDLRDYDSDAQTLEFVHRPDFTPLKNKQQGERVVGLSKPIVDVLNTYIARERADKRDEKGRKPLFAGRQGRPSKTTFRSWSYLATLPCVTIECPHGRRRETCDYTRRNFSSKCPSSRSPHAVRTGSITWQLLEGLKIETIAKRVNAKPETIRRHYYRAGLQEEFEELRADVTLDLDIGFTDD